jgi:hypothetical protein
MGFATLYPSYEPTLLILYPEPVIEPA